MSSSLTVLRSCGDHVEAESIRMRLAAAGIRAIVTGTDMATALGLGGAGTMRMVRVEVPNEDAQRAHALLEEDERRAAEMGPWICSRCREQNEATFEVCWSCSKPRDDRDQRGRLESPLPSAASLPASIETKLDPIAPDDGNPYRPVLRSDAEPRPTIAVAEPTETMSDDVTRALRAAIVGSFVFPPLICFYSLLLLAKLDTSIYQHATLRRRVIVAWIINLTMIPGWTILWTTM